MPSWKPAFASAVAAALFFGAAPVRAQHQHGSNEKAAHDKTPALPVCPVMGDPVDFSVKLTTKTGPVYFCCPRCIKKYAANPSKYAKALAKQRSILAKLPKVQVACPVTGEAVDSKSFTEFKGEKIYFCCDRCIAKFKKDPSKYKEKLAAGYTYQTKCPVTGETIDPAASMKTGDGKTVYFCCPGCQKKFLADPAKYAPKLEAQGTIIDPDKAKPDKSAKKDDHEGHAHGDHDGH